MKLEISYERLTSQNYSLIKFDLYELKFNIDVKDFNQLLIYER
jgi:hypothetical protein